MTGPVWAFVLKISKLNTKSPLLNVENEQGKRPVSNGMRNWCQGRMGASNLYANGARYRTGRHAQIFFPSEEI
jgi:hypothetical protein